MKYNNFKQQFHIMLNPQQEAAVQKTDGAVLLLAVPGSGKTTVLVTRLGYMVHCCGIKPEEILTVTYTVAATNDMRRRFAAKFGDEYADRLEFRTINGISQKILQHFGNMTGKSVYGVADKETGSIVKNVFFNVTGKYATENDIKAVQTAITYAKNMRFSQEQIAEMDVDIDSFPEIYRGYHAELRRLSLIDYDDQMVYALRILEQYPEVLVYFQQTYRYICVDEAQDTSKIQHDMINLLAAKSGNLFMVGDEDQSIYGFRAAYPEALVHFEETHAGATVLLMESNYRSNEEIVTAADKLIQANKKRHKKQMVPIRPSGGSVIPIKVNSRKRQYHYLVKVAGECDRETAVLYRNNESALPLIDMLERRNIPYCVKNSDMTFFSHPVVNDICDYIKLALNPYDGEAFLRIYYKMGAGISKAAALQVVQNDRRRKSLLDAVADLNDISVYTKKQCRALSTHFANMKRENTGKAIYRILHYMGYQDYMYTHGMDYGKAEILLLLGEQENNLRSFPERLCRLHEIVSNGCSHKKSEFILSTIHSSKGLEYERVYLADMIAGIMPYCTEPGGNAPDSAEVSAYEEERRLYYVGMTRAKNELYIFTFDDAETSKFTREVFGIKPVLLRTQAVKGSDKPAVSVYNTYKDEKDGQNAGKEVSRDAFQIGTTVCHKTFGKGVITDRKEDIVEILFERDSRTRSLALLFALGKGLLAVSKDNKTE